ncbi:MAG: hypothetical protein LBR53_11755 [Deltaproteobacteria bacterium]|nr:hypothetical protein [Deltaproteobacteria bacterium]
MDPEISGFSLHNRFIATTLRHVKPGGVAAFVVSAFLLDRKDMSARRDIASRAELPGAPRLPSGTFCETGLTEVTADLAVFGVAPEDRLPCETERTPAEKLFARAVEGANPTVRDKDDDGKSRKNERETEIAARKAEVLRQVFRARVSGNPAAGRAAEAAFDSRFNRHVPPSHDGSFYEFPGMSSTVTLGPHQKNAVYRGLRRAGPS